MHFFSNPCNRRPLVVLKPSSLTPSLLPFHFSTPLFRLMPMVRVQLIFRNS